MELSYLSKAKRVDNREWVDGYLTRYGHTGKEKYYIVPSYASDFYSFLIDENTICRCIGSKDKNGILIWENDIVSDSDIHGVVTWDDVNARYVIDDKDSGYQDYSGRWNEVNVIGNKFDTPELLRSKIERLTNSDKEIPTLMNDNAEYWLRVYFKLKDYEDAEEQKLILWLPCKVGDTVYLIDRDENNEFKVYEGKWERLSLVQTSKGGPFEVCGEISYDAYDWFYTDGRTSKRRMYVGQENTKIGEVVFLTRKEAEVKLEEME